MGIQDEVFTWIVENQEKFPRGGWIQLVCDRSEGMMEGMAFKQYLQHVQMCRSTKDALCLSFNFIERLGAFYKMTVEGWAEISLRRPSNTQRASSANGAVLQGGWHWEPFKDFGADVRMPNARLI